MLKALSFGSGTSGGMGAIRLDDNWSQGCKAVIVFFSCPDAGGGVRVGEEGSP